MYILAGDYSVHQTRDSRSAEWDSWAMVNGYEGEGCEREAGKWTGYHLYVFTPKKVNSKTSQLWYAQIVLLD